MFGEIRNDLLGGDMQTGRMGNRAEQLLTGFLRYQSSRFDQPAPPRSGAAFAPEKVKDKYISLLFLIHPYVINVEYSWAICCSTIIWISKPLPIINIIVDGQPCWFISYTRGDM